MTNLGKKFAAGGKIAVGGLGAMAGVVEGIGRVAAGLARRDGGLIAGGVTDGVHRAKLGWHVIEEGFDDWQNADR